MKKILDIRLKTVVQQPTQNKLLLKWRELTNDYGVVYIPYSDAVPSPLDTLSILERYFFELGIVPPPVLTQLLSPMLQRRETNLPKSKGGWRTLTLLQESPKGLTAQAKILTRLTDNDTHLKIFLQIGDNCHCKASQESETHLCNCCPYMYSF